MILLQDGYALDEHGVHHRVLDAVLESKPGTDCYGWVDVYGDHLDLAGVGDLDSQKMPFGNASAEGHATKAVLHAEQSNKAEDATLDRQP